MTNRELYTVFFVMALAGAILVASAYLWMSGEIQDMSLALGGGFVGIGLALAGIQAYLSRVNR